MALIDMIYTYENNNVKIVSRYQDPFQEAMKYIQNNKDLLEKEQAKALLARNILLSQTCDL